MCVCGFYYLRISVQTSRCTLSSLLLTVMASPIFVQPSVKNTFIHFDIDHFGIKAHERSASAPPRSFFAEDASSRSKIQKRKRTAPSLPKAHGKAKEIDENVVLDEFAQLARAESWAVFGKWLIERQERIEDMWDHLKNKLLQTSPNKNKKRFTLTRRLFFNAVPWVNPADMLRARKDGFLRPIEPDSMEFWASDADLISKSLAPIFSVFVQFRNMVERGEMMMMLPCGTTFVYSYRRNLHLDDLRAKVKATSSQPYDKQRLVCQGQELKGSRVLGDFDLRPGDVISVLFS